MPRRRPRRPTIGACRRACPCAIWSISEKQEPNEFQQPNLPAGAPSSVSVGPLESSPSQSAPRRWMSRTSVRFSRIAGHSAVRPPRRPSPLAWADPDTMRLKLRSPFIEGILRGRRPHGKSGERSSSAVKLQHSAPPSTLVANSSLTAAVRVRRGECPVSLSACQPLAYTWQRPRMQYGVIACVSQRTGERTSLSRGPPCIPRGCKFSHPEGQGLQASRPTGLTLCPATTVSHLGRRELSSGCHRETGRPTVVPSVLEAPGALAANSTSEDSAAVGASVGRKQQGPRRPLRNSTS